ncbi:MAG: hypothetical protein GXO39_00075 [Thermotogae bacterium]|nr:hypothetical protein [Thermotogota bacterium]
MSFPFIFSLIIDTVVVSGNRWTKSSYILRYLNLHMVDTLTDSSLIEIEKRLWQLGLFRGVNLQVVRDTLKIKVEEMWYIYPVPYLSVSTTELTYGLTLLHMNWRGVGENLYTTLTLGARRMFILGWNTPKHRLVENILSLKGGREIYNSFLYLMPINRTFLAFSFSNRLDGRLRLKVDLNLERIGSDSSHLLFAGDDDAFMKVSYSLYYDSRDWANYPRRGFYVKGGISSYMGEFVAWTYGASVSSFFTFKRLTFKPFLSVWRTFGDLPLYLKFPLTGRSDVLREGHPEERYVGRSLDVASIELRYLVFEKLPPPVGKWVSGGLATVLYLDMGRTDTLSAFICGLGALSYTPFGTFIALAGYGTHGFQFFFGESRRIW